MRRIIDFYRLQIQVMRDWQPSGGSRVRRLVATLLISVVSLGGAVFFTPGFDMVPGSPIVGTLLLGAITLGLLNLLVRPVFLALFAGVSVIAVAIATIVFQIATFLLLPRFIDELQASGIIVALVASLDLRDGQHHPRRAVLDHQRRLVLRRPDAAARRASVGRRPDRQAGAGRDPDRRARGADPRPPGPRRARPAPLRLAAVRPLRARRVGGAAAADDARRARPGSSTATTTGSPRSAGTRRTRGA